MRLIIIAVLAAFPFQSFANLSGSAVSFPSFVTIDGLTGKPVQDVIVKSIKSFRGPPTPMSVAVKVLMPLVLMYVIDKAGNRVAVTAGKDVPPLTPQGWTDPQTPPGTAAHVNGYSCGPSPCTVQSSIDSACAQAMQQGSSIYDSYSVSGSSCTLWYKDPWKPGYSQIDIRVQVGCPSGYADAGDNCTIIPGSVQWPTDGVPTYEVSPSGLLVPNPLDPDNGTITQTQQIHRAGLDDYGNSVVEDVTPNSQGGIDYTRQTQTVEQTTGQPMVTKDTIQTDNTGTVTNSSNYAFTNTTISNVTNTSNPSQSMTLPTDYARENTLQKTNTELQQINDKLTPASSDHPPTVAEKPTLESSFAKITTAFKDNVPLPSFDDTGATCPTFSHYIPFLDTDLTINAFCDLEPYIRPILETASTMLWLILGFFIVIKA